MLGANRKHREGAQHQENESRKDKDVHRPGEFVARMLPLAEPELENVSEATPWPVETRIAFRAEQGHHAFRYDVREARDSQDMNRQKQASSRNEPV
jgi:hypothetical protein